MGRLGPGEGSAGLAASRVAAGDASGYAADRSPAYERFGVCGDTFVVSGQPAVGGQPGQRPFHDPSAGVYGEALLVGGFAHDLERGLGDVGGSADQSAGEALVGEDVPHRRCGKLGGYQCSFGSVAVLPRACQHPYGDQ